MTTQIPLNAKPKYSRHARKQVVHTNESLNETAYRTIKGDIISCELRPGQEVSEGVLVEHYGFSKAPLRNALMRLRQERLVVSRGRLGNIVAPITLQDVHEIFHLRLILEVESTRLAAGRVDPTRLKELDSAVHAGYTPGDKESEQAYLQTNREFHRYVAEASGNQRLTAIVVNLIEQHERIVHLGLALQNKGHEFHHYHDALIKALIEADGERAAELTEVTVRGSQEKVMESLLSMSNPLSLEIVPSRSS